MAIRMTGMASGLDTDSLIKGMVDAQKLKNKKTSDKSQVLEWKQEKLKELNTKLYKLYAEDLTKLRTQGAYNTKKVTTSNENLLSVTANSNAPLGSAKVNITSLATSQSVTSGKLDETTTGNTTLMSLGAADGGKITITNGTNIKEFSVSSTTTVNDFVSTLKKAGLNANYDNTQKRIFITSSNSGTENKFSITEADGSTVLSSMKLGNVAENAVSTPLENTSVNNSMTVVAASDAVINYNGVEIKSSTNTVSVNGYTMTLKGKPAAGEVITINTETNKEGIVKDVKDFVKKYNEILKEMNDLYYASNSKGYAPLSDEEKESMSESQIDKWEEKIKGSMLRRDDSIGSVLEGLKTITSQTVKGSDGKTYSLASLGIGTSKDYTEKGLLHIDGDSEDSSVSMNEDKLSKMLEQSPEIVSEILSQTMNQLYTEIDGKIKSIPNVRSVFTFYNDKTMGTQQTNYKKKITELESKLLDIENKYYKQFAAMEKAMSELQSQQSSLAGFFG